MASNTTANLDKVWGSGSNSVVAVGQNGTIMYYNGAGWELQESGTSESLTDVWAASNTDYYIVGYGSTVIRSSPK
jgi:hypothetical protein